MFLENLKIPAKAAKITGYLIGVALTITVGIVLLCLSSGERETRGGALSRLSYDLPFNLRHRVPEDLVVVYIDETVKQRLGQPVDVPLDRRFYTRLLKRLSDDGARLVLLDIIFDAPGQDSEVDNAFADAIRNHGRVVLVADANEQRQANIASSQISMPTPVLRQAAAGCGLANVDDEKADAVVRRIYEGTDQVPAACVMAARLLGVHLASSLQNRWLNYYCPPRHLQSINLDQALEPEGPGKAFFHDKIVIVGALSRAQVAGVDNDIFANPYSRFGVSLFTFGMPAEQRVLCNSFSPGAAVHGFSLLNLIHGNWLRRMSFGLEMALVVAWGLCLSLCLMRLHPWLAVGVGFLSAIVMTCVGAYVHLNHQIWFAWAIPVAAQTPTALVWGVSFQYFIESRRRQRLRRAFGAYLSPYMADAIADSDVDLKPGGKEVEATILFTDLEGFTSMSEGLSPGEVSNLLISYFNKTTTAILSQDGTVSKFIGDAVMAFWGAPLAQPDGAERAVLAAWGIQQAIREPILGRRWHTRIGINTGLVLAGNLGSDSRFDYTLIGDASNIAARLETLNKPLGTELLISESTASRLSKRFQLRKVGRFILAGKSVPVSVCEVLGVEGEVQQPWVSAFAQALDSWSLADFDQATKMFREAIRLRDGRDGPSEFFLKEIERVSRRTGRPVDWDGTLRVGKGEQPLETGFVQH